MKPCSLYIAAAIGISVWGRNECVAEPLILSAPIIVQVTGVDHRHVTNLHGELVDKKVAIPLDGEVCVVFKDAQQLEVEALVRYGVFSHCPVYLVDGSKLIAFCHVVGEASDPLLYGAPTEYGFILRFSSVQEAERAAQLIRSQATNPKQENQELEELIRIHKRDLDNPTAWIVQPRSNTTLEPTATARSDSTKP